MVSRILIGPNFFGHCWNWNYRRKSVHCLLCSERKLLVRTVNDCDQRWMMLIVLMICSSSDHWMMQDNGLTPQPQTSQPQVRNDAIKVVIIGKISLWSLLRWRCSDSCALCWTTQEGGGLWGGRAAGVSVSSSLWLLPSLTQHHTSHYHLITLHW